MLMSIKSLFGLFLLGMMYDVSGNEVNDEPAGRPVALANVMFTVR